MWHAIYASAFLVDFPRFNPIWTIFSAKRSMFEEKQKQIQKKLMWTTKERSIFETYCHLFTKSWLPHSLYIQIQLDRTRSIKLCIHDSHGVWFECHSRKRMKKKKKKTFSINPIIISSNSHQYNTTNKLATTKVSLIK